MKRKDLIHMLKKFKEEVLEKARKQRYKIKPKDHLEQYYSKNNPMDSARSSFSNMSQLSDIDDKYTRVSKNMLKKILLDHERKIKTIISQNIFQ